MYTNFVGTLPQTDGGEYNYASTQSPNTFSEHSDIRTGVMSQSLANTSKQINVLSAELTRGSVMKDRFGRKVTNMTPERQWFQDNISILIVRGLIYDSFDEQTMADLLANFDKNSSIQLTCDYICYDYTEDVVKAIERELTVSNGDYHIMVVPIVITKDPSTLMNAPEPTFGKPGIVDAWFDINHIHEVFREWIVKYAFVYEHAETRTPTSHDIGVDGTHVKIGPQFDSTTMFNIEGELDPICQRDIDNEFAVNLRDKDNIGVRQRHVHEAREAGYGANSTRDRNRKNGSLLTRVWNDQRTPIVDTTIPSDKDGVILRYNERMIPPDRVTAEFQLFDDPETYDASTGKNKMEEASKSRRDMPTMQLVNRRGPKSRVVRNTAYPRI